MKTGILTFHAGFNHGAFLQAYALQNTLFDLHVDNEIIHYQDTRQFLNEYKCALITRDLPTFPQRIGRLIKFLQSQNKCKLTQRMFRIDKDTINKTFETIVFGSDEIWNLSNCVFGHDPVFFGQDLHLKKISYAPSFGSAPPNTRLPDHVIDNLNSFASISVRDLNSQKIIKRHLGIVPPIVPDPTFLHDIFAKAVPTKHTNFILIYALHLSHEMRQGIEALSQKEGKPIISVGYKTDWAHTNIINLSPFQLLGFYKAADMVFTDLFHGTIFSILANKNFILELSSYRQNKFFPMLHMLGLTHRILDHNVFEILDDEIDYTDVNFKIAQFKAAGLDYLNQSLHS